MNENEEYAICSDSFWAQSHPKLIRQDKAKPKKHIKYEKSGQTDSIKFINGYNHFHPSKETYNILDDTKNRYTFILSTSFSLKKHQLDEH